MYSSLIVIDEFYDQPMKIRAAALGCDYPEVAGTRTFPGRTSSQKLLPPGLDQVVSRIVMEPLAAAKNRESFHGHFRLTRKNEESRYKVHVDPSALSWVGVVYLSLPEHCRGGTSFFRHRALDSDRTPLDNEPLRALGVDNLAGLLRRDGPDPDKWEQLMTVPMRFNRLILYRPWLWHSAEGGFGDSDETARLIQLVAFRPAAEPSQGPGAAG